MKGSCHVLTAGLLLGASVAAAQWAPAPNTPYPGQPAQLPQIPGEPAQPGQTPAPLPGQPGQPAQGLAREFQPIEYAPPAQFNANQSGNYKYGNWEYSYDVAGQVGKGWLTYNSRRLDTYAQVNQYMRTPWGYMAYYGKKANAEGWIRTSVPQINQWKLQPVASPPAAERADRLKQDLDRFQLLLMYQGTQDAQNPFPNLVLRVPPFGAGEAQQGNVQQVQLSRDQATSLITHLSYDGFLDDARESNAQPAAGQPVLGGQLPPIPGQPVAAANQNYTIQVLGGSAQNPLTLQQQVPVDQQLVARLRDLNRALATDATRVLRPLIARIEKTTGTPPGAIGSE